MVEVTDGTAEYNATHYRVSFFYDLAKAANIRTAFAWRYVPDVQDAGKPADTTGYR